MKLKAKWIWKAQKDRNPYNQTIIAKRRISLDSVRKATMAITADSFYRLFINGQWVNDGPCRSWPSHFQYDEIDVAPYLREGLNELTVIARYFGVGTFHQVPQQAGLLAQVEVVGANGKTTTILTDKNWTVAEAKAWVSNTPKVSIQMEPFEHYDARLESSSGFSKAKVLYDAEGGPWKDLNARDTALLTRQPFAFSNYLGAKAVSSAWLSFTFPVASLLHPGPIEAQRNVSLASGVATVVRSARKKSLRIESPDYHITVNGQTGKDGLYELSSGANLLLATTAHFFSHNKEASIRFVDTTGFKLANPLQPKHENPWCFIVPASGVFQTDDMIFPRFPTPGLQEYSERVGEELRALRDEVTDLRTFRQTVGKRARCLPSEKMLVHDSYWRFSSRHVLENADSRVENPTGLMYDNGEVTVVSPTGNGDVEIAYDLGEQNCGYYGFDLIADEGVQIDVFGIENIGLDGALQHSLGNRNGMTYICRAGKNQFISLKRRSGRYVYITIRNQSGPVRIRHFHLIESTYPVVHQGRFSCSDPVLDEIWKISARTLKLCMEDTFTDCPLYEQTLWVGDARNEAVFAYTAFGATDIARRCLRIPGESLEKYPITGCQVPSCWDCLLPAWSFLWGIAVWEYYFYTGDRKFLKTAWKWVKKNLQGAKEHSDKLGLFSGPFWNMFDWTNIDCGHRTVLHNSMFVVGAIDAALKCAEVLRDEKSSKWLKAYRRRLVKALNKLWDEEIGSYPDSIYEDGTVSSSICQHTSFLAILYDIIEKKNLSKAVENTTRPREEMVKVGSPFAIMYLYEALEKIDMSDEVVKSIYRNYMPMLEAGATTVWETFPRGNIRHGSFATRSHCHAWSSAPIHFLNRIILGIKQTGPAGESFDITPQLNGLDWAQGATATVKGPVEVEWKRESNQLTIVASAPEGVRLQFVRNHSHKNLKVKFDVRRQGT